MEKRVVITVGDPAGIGPEVVSESVNSLSLEFPSCEFLIVGDEVLLNNSGLKKNSNVSIKQTGELNLSTFQRGKVSSSGGKLSLGYIEEALKLIDKDTPLITAPISKEAINLAGAKWSGHTELLADYFAVEHPVMMMVGENIKVSLVTRHIPLIKVSGELSKGLIVHTIDLTYKVLKDGFKIGFPRIGICGLNPHAGESGLLGKEEDGIIIPAIEVIKKKSIEVSGPFPADTAFIKLKEKHLDALVAMYHDQALIPFKLLDFHDGVNLTLGLPVIRTSPAHGTAMDIVQQKGKIDPGSMKAAIRLAIKLSFDD